MALGACQVSRASDAALVGMWRARGEGPRCRLCAGAQSAGSQEPKIRVLRLPTAANDRAMSTKDEVTEALEASIAADMRVRECVRAAVYGHSHRDPMLVRQLVQERNAAFANFLQAFMRRSRAMSMRAANGPASGQP